jgi:hypothetical protein
MRRSIGLFPAALLTAGLVAGCGSAPTDTVPSLGGATVSVGGTGGQARALHAAAQCIRDHGVPAYQDPVVAPDGSVYTDQRSLQDAGRDDRAFLDRVRTACQSLLDAAHFNPGTEPRATPELVRAGVAAARCLRTHGLSNYRDPTATTAFTPGHGFGITPDELPAGGKTNAVVQRALTACRPLLDTEIDASRLSSLSHG